MVSFPIARDLPVQNVIQITGTIFPGRVGEVEFGAAGQQAKKRRI
jgi:hypothetical protein